MMVRHKAQNVSARPRTGDVQISEDTDFKSMLLPQPILNGLKKSGYIKPSPIQKKALPLVRCGLDLIVQAKAGTGKTCVFTVAALELVKPNLPHLQAIILAPTREIALQITSVINAIGQCVEGLKIGCFIGGYPLSADVEKVKGCHVAVAAPGRLRHLLDKGLLNPHHVRLFVLDEADKLMENVFAKDINAIFAQLPDSKQVLACSATYTDELVEFLSNYMNGGQYISPHQTISPTVLLGVRQFVSVIPRHVDRLAQLKLKEKQLLYLLRSISFNQCLVFSNLHTRAVSLCSLLRVEGWGVEWIAGRQEQKDRVAALTQLRDQRVRVLVTTDLTARGIDVENVNLVINLDLPMDHHTYLHRMGRAGRYGSHGIVITVVSDGQELTGFQKLIGMIGGAAQSVNRVPQNLKNIDLWTMSDEKFEKICGIIEKKASSPSNSEKAEDSATSTAEKYSPESSDSEGYVKEFKEETGAPESSDNKDYDKEHKGRNGAPESSDSEDYVKEYKEGNGVGQSGAFDCAGKISGISGVSQGFNGAGNFEKTRDTSGITSYKTDDSTSSDEKFSRDSSDDEAESAEYSCVCSLYEADAADIKVIAGPSLFALKKEDHWREVLPVIVNESKVPLNTPIALLDSKLIRVRFWDKTQRLNRNIQVDIPSKESLNFDTKSEDKDFLSFKDIVSYLENGIRIEDSVKSICDNTDRQILSFGNIEEALESGFCEMDERTIVKSDEIEAVLIKYNKIKERSESALISFDSFDLVGWLAVDELHNIIEEISIDKCEVFIFNLVTCLAGKNHIEVFSPREGSSKVAHDYIDQITTFNVERFPLLTLMSLSNIAQHITNIPSKSSDKILRNNTHSHMKPSNNKVAEQVLVERQICDLSHDTKMKSLLINPLKVPIIDSNNKKNVTKKNIKYASVNEQGKCNSSGIKNAVTSHASKRTNQTNSYIRPTSNSNNKRMNERMVHPEISSTSYKNQVSKYDKKTKNDSKHDSSESLQATIIRKKQHQMSPEAKNSTDSGPYVEYDSSESLQATIIRKKQHQMSPEAENSTDSGPYVDMTWNWNPLKGIHAIENKKLKSSATNAEQQPQLSFIKNSSIQESLGAESKIIYQCESKSQDKSKHLNGFEQTPKHRNSDDSYDSFDTVEYETTDLDKERYQMFNENGTQKKHHHTKHQDSTTKNQNPKFNKPKVLHSKQERSKSHDSRNKQSHKESQDTYSSIESESANPHPTSLHKVPYKRDQKSRNKNLHEVRHKTLFNETEESYKESYDSCNSIDTEISKLRELNYKLQTKRKYQNDHRHKQVQEESEDVDSSVESGGTNRHSFRTACSEHLGEEYDCHHGGISNRSSRLSNHYYENHFEIPFQTNHSKFRTAKYSDRDEFNHHYFQRSGGREEKFPQEQEFSQNEYCHEPYGSYDCNQFETYQNNDFQYDPQDFSNFPGSGSSQILRGANLHHEWYSNWYLRVRQRAMQLAIMEYTNNMSTL